MTQESSSDPSSQAADDYDCVHLHAVRWLTPYPDAQADLVEHLPDGRVNLFQLKTVRDEMWEWYDRRRQNREPLTLQERQLVHLFARWRVMQQGSYAKPTPVKPPVDEDLQTLVIVYLSSSTASEETLDRVKAAIQNLGADIVDETDVVHGSIWQAFVAAFKRTATQERLEEAGEYAVAAARNKVYAETQAAVTRTLTESVVALLEALKDEQTASILVGNLFVAKIDGCPFAMELTAAQVTAYHSDGKLQSDPAAALATFRSINGCADPQHVQTTQLPPTSTQAAIEQ
ncbi:hypothetical protein [Nonomuraea dietziae]|uniref:hypothetical protein n=1 Tax=Nonomuraea dietziae TaxID=65515 RepID=UPI0034275FDF